jgi:hypothetical protein
MDSSKGKKPNGYKTVPFNEVVKRLLNTPPPNPQKTKAKRRPK